MGDPKTSPLSDDDVYARLHEAWLLFSGLSVQTPLALDVVTIMLRQIETMQRAMIIVREGGGEGGTAISPSESPPDP